MIKHHVNNSKAKVNYFVFEGSYIRIRQFFSQDDVSVHNFVIRDELNDLEQTVASLLNPDVIVIDSLSSLLIRFGLADTYKVLHSIANDKSELNVMLHFYML